MRGRIPAVVGAAAAAAGGAMAQECIWTTGAGGPTETSGAIAFHSGLGSVVYIQPTGPLRTWSWNGTSWSVINSLGPPQRYGYSAAYDIARNRLVLFGGFLIPGGAHPADTWESDGLSLWSQFAAGGPVGREGQTLTYDVARGRTVLFGGWSGSSYLGDTWEWNGAAWSQAVGAGPSARSDSAAAYDAGRQRIAIYGGRDSAGELGDMWEWDGLAWAQRPSDGPGTRSGASMMFDSSRATLVMIGGGRTNAPLGTEVWELPPASSQWVMRGGSGPPYGHATFDPIRGRGVLVPQSGSTWLYNPQATLASPWIVQQPQGGTFPPGMTVMLTVVAAGTEPLSYQWLNGTAVLTNSGRYSGVTTPTLTIASGGPGEAGTYIARITNPCGQIASRGATVLFQGDPTCYANCDRTTSPPILNVEDFICFQSAFAGGDPYANCDGSTTPPVLNVNDFQCFMAHFAGGC